MMQSALEKEIHSRLLVLTSWMRSHDRGVLFALLLSVPPLPPIPFLGFILSLLNLWLWKNERLDQSEGGVIKFSIFLSLATSFLGLFLVMHVLVIIKFIPDYFPIAIATVHGFIDFLRGLFSSGFLSHQTLKV